MRRDALKPDPWAFHLAAKVTRGATQPAWNLLWLPTDCWIKPNLLTQARQALTLRLLPPFLWLHLGISSTRTLLRALWF